MRETQHSDAWPEGAVRNIRGGWTEARAGDRYVLARHWPARFDLQASRVFPPARRGRLARQIRQDLWREFQGLRGFSPVVQVVAAEDGLLVTAGGRLMKKTPVPENAKDRIASLLESPAHRARWLNWAKPERAQ